MGHEGGYTDDPIDAGGETYKGISRKYHPHWDGWVIVDTFKLPGWRVSKMAEHEELQRLVRLFYKQTFWNPWLGDFVANISQEVAEEMFDTGVNMGVHRCQKFLQEGLNKLNRAEKLYPNLVEDGKVGSRTLSALKKLPAKDHEVLLKMLNVMQGRHYLAYMSKSEDQERFARGWFSRVSL